VTRRPIDGKNPDGWFPQQRITAEQALRGYTSTAAYAAFEEQEKGTLSQGRLADFVLLSRDILSVAPAQIPETQVAATVVGGRVVYERK
jgi:predicted amidohydrolase YtcJ